MWLLTAAGLLAAALAWAQPASVGCGPGQAGCGPAAVGTGGTTTTTIPVGTDWCAAMVGCWMLDEASGNARVNAQGLTSRNLAETGGAVANDPTNKMQGTAAALFAAGPTLQTSDPALGGLVVPFTCGFWARKTATNSMIVATVGNAGTGFSVWHNSDTNWEWDMPPGAALYFTPGNALNPWTHVALRQVGTTSQTYKDGLPRTNATRTYTPAALAFTLGSSSYAGQLDEAWCAAVGLSDASVCRICSCGVRGEQCTCTGAAYSSTGRNASACNACTLPANCSAGPT